MLLKVTAMDDPEDLPGVEKVMRVAAVSNTSTIKKRRSRLASAWPVP
jgi:hypothetical protein